MTSTTKEFSTVKIKTDFCFINENNLFICHRIMNNTEPSLPAQCVLTLWGCVTGLFKYICFFFLPYFSHINVVKCKPDGLEIPNLAKNQQLNNQTILNGCRTDPEITQSTAGL